MFPLRLFPSVACSLSALVPFLRLYQKRNYIQGYVFNMQFSISADNLWYFIRIKLKNKCREQALGYKRRVQAQKVQAQREQAQFREQPQKRNKPCGTVQACIDRFEKCLGCEVQHFQAGDKYRPSTWENVNLIFKLWDILSNVDFDYISNWVH